MKTKNFVVGALMFSVLLPIGAKPASALSCLPVDMYLEQVVGKEEEVVIFEATSLEVNESKEYTSEVVKVTKAEQGWVDDTLFVYHKKHPDWNYFCNNGPIGKGKTAVYIASRNEQNQYSVHQTLAVTDPLVKELRADLAKAKMEGVLNETTKESRLSQIVITIEDLIKQIKTLLEEHKYWSKSK